ncbi:Cys-tRNA(Pro) deacylase [Treponema vincentii]|jgi:ybaK/ebsC protein|uniref:Cys-tRNA(Pro)/Cys-tRNA(Cys) deacylase n=2 Tax=Treponema vincentii TaxID=69710 RepID=S3LCT1_9SPIR|nr:Cys-tRNA(Pro) deacylase [Treponema vincentii]EEV21581.1 YbaK/EbsC protein [Treponema vincentii ATCC 35580]EPF47510.1 YbaK/EbsC protein [Treponema vincentii F0403]UTC46627.1 Cys-tRNA(Pro) deacylase [Treponema vincentii]UTC49001.1 Cys-tRNA(Pro) deacylase [Treponema vincentii]UTC59472.1 Cys-tRNA(Pro) deacylase [Treponema vincentii]
MKKTNAMRILEAAGIPYSSIEYAWDEEHLDAVTAAHKLNIEPDMLFKTIVMISEDNEVFVFCVPAPAEVSLKKARTLTGKKITPLKLEALQKTTGYIRGGCSPLGMKKHFPTFIDETAQLYDLIYVSAGERGHTLGIAPTDLQQICAAAFCDIAET